jgi:hypothetical protein
LKKAYFSPDESATGKNAAILGSEIARRIFDTLILWQQSHGVLKLLFRSILKGRERGITDSGMMKSFVREFRKTFSIMRSSRWNPHSDKEREGFLEELSDEKT